jgi:hypothetical protein
VEISHKQDQSIRNIIVALKVDLWITWYELSATLDQRRSPQCGGRLWLNQGKNRRVCCLLSWLWVLSSLVLIFTCNIAPSLILTLRGQSSEEFVFLSSYHPNLVLVLTNTFLDQICVVWSIFHRITYSPRPSRCSHPPGLNLIKLSYFISASQHSIIKPILDKL